MAWEQPRGDRQPPKRLAFADVLALEPRDPVADAATLKEVQARFEQGVAMLHMRQFEYALTAFHQVLALAPRIPEAHVNMGFALIGLEQWKQARDFFESAIELRRDQINAYYGLALTLEALGDRPGAMGAMQTYLHRSPVDDAFRARAESAMWEWRSATRDSAGVTRLPRPPSPDRTLSRPAPEESEGISAAVAEVVDGNLAEK